MGLASHAGAPWRPASEPTLPRAHAQSEPEAGKGAAVAPGWWEGHRRGGAGTLARATGCATSASVVCIWTAAREFVSCAGMEPVLKPDTS